MRHANPLLLSVSLCITAMVAAPQAAHAWDSDGHQVIGAIADQLLKGTPAAPKVRALLADIPSLSQAAVWADCAKGYTYCHKALTPEMKSFVAANPQHHEYHYTDVPIEETHYVAGGIGTTDHDVVQTIIQAAAALRGDTAGNPHHFSRREAILLLAHHVGDLHQPLHVGAVYLTREGDDVNPTAAELEAGTVLGTQGGNRLHINGTTHVLHAYWDSDAMKALMRKKKVKTPEALATQLLAEHPQPTPLSRNIPANVKGWADGTLEACRVAFHGVGFSAYRTDLPDDGPDKAEGWAVTLPATYSQVASDVAAQQLLLAGKRLAALLAVVLK